MTPTDSLPAISALLTETESAFRSELQTKQSLIDQTHAKLREQTALLSEERRRLADFQHKSEERKALRQRVANLRRANEQQRAQLVAHNSQTANDIRSDIKVGEADAGLAIDAATLSAADSTLLPHQREYLATLPPAAVLKARVIAYRKNNARLEALAKSLQSQSSGLEAQLRKVVSLCTGVEESKVDEMVDGLSVAVESEGGEDVEVARVREFLRRVEGGVE